MCGNGIRCVGKFVYDKKLTTKDTITIEKLAGIKVLKMKIINEKVESARIDTGEPILIAEKNPVISEEMPVKNLKLKAEDKEFVFTCVSMGNSYAITFINENLKDLILYQSQHNENIPVEVLYDEEDFDKSLIEVKKLKYIISKNKEVAK